MTVSTSIPLPKGFRAGGLHCGIKKEALDLAMIVSDGPAVGAGVFTKNLICGAPVQISRERLPGLGLRGVIINSGNANACTGTQGLEDARWMTAEAARQFGAPPDSFLVCSTGVIGRFLNREKLEKGILSFKSVLQSTSEGLHTAAHSIMTTDTVPKLSSRTSELGYCISGIAKGAAMIAPNLATMLCVIVTDAALQPAQADEILRRVADRTFNCISVDGHTSTSDSVILLANGASGVKPQSELEIRKFEALLEEVARELAMAIIHDAEGATHIITLDVRGFQTREDAFRIAKEIADSPLVKTAIHGADPNWGRIISAAGYAGVPLQEIDLSLKINGHSLYSKGQPLPFEPAVVSRSIRETRETSIELDATLGDQSVRYWTSDLTAEYVRLNSDYTT